MLGERGVRRGKALGHARELFFGGALTFLGLIDVGKGLGVLGFDFSTRKMMFQPTTNFWTLYFNGNGQPHRHLHDPENRATGNKVPRGPLN